MWLTSIPFALIRACVTMLPRLQAEESIRATQHVAVGTGSLERGDSQRITDRWAAAAQPNGRRPPRQTNPATLAAIGIGYTVVP